MTTITEAEVEQTAFDWLPGLGWAWRTGWRWRLLCLLPLRGPLCLRG